jgi:hypothetical protein
MSGGGGEVRVLYYSAKKMVMGEKYLQVDTDGESDATPKSAVPVNGYYNGFSVFQMPQAVGTYYAYLSRMKDTGDSQYIICDAGFVNLYNDPARIYVKEIAEKVGMLRTNGVVVSLATSDYIREMEAFLTGWFMHIDVPTVYLQLVSVLHKNTDRWIQLVNDYKSDSLLAGQPATVQSIFRFVVVKTAEWHAQHSKVFGVPLAMIVKETGLKEATVMEYLRRLEAVGLVKVNVIDKKYYYLPIEQ